MRIGGGATISPDLRLVNGQDHSTTLSSHWHMTCRGCDHCKRSTSISLVHMKAVFMHRLMDKCVPISPEAPLIEILQATERQLSLAPSSDQTIIRRASLCYDLLHKASCRLPLRWSASSSIVVGGTGEERVFDVSSRSVSSLDVSDASMRSWDDRARVATRVGKLKLCLLVC